MKPLFLTLVSALLMTGCSPKSGSSTGQPEVVQATDLGKAEEYFRNLYGAPKAATRVAEFAFSLPGRASPIHLAGPFAIQDFESGKLKAKVLYSGSPQRALWVKYTLPNPWTQEQLSAALQPYAADWKIVPENLGMTFIMRERAPGTYRSSTGCLAYKSMFNELTVYAPQLLADLAAQIQETARQQKAVPKF